MRAKGNHNDWLGLVADASGASFIAVRGSRDGFVLAAHDRIDVNLEALGDNGWRTRLRKFVDENKLVGRAAHLLFVGSGTVVQKLQMPPMSTRNRGRAVRTRLTNYASGRSLVVDTRLDDGGRTGKRVGVLAAGVDCRLVRGLYQACRQAGLRPTSATALAAAFAAPKPTGRAVQLVLAESTTTIQLFEDGRLICCRDVLLGQRDFVAAYQRPILTDDQPVTLSPEQARRLLREVGVPIGREDEIQPGISAARLWPVLTPVLQRLRTEVEQTMAQYEQDGTDARCLSVLALPALPGLADYLAAELELEALVALPEQTETSFLAALYDSGTGDRPLDLRPSEERFVARAARPALAACAAALLIIVANSATPRQAQAQLSALTPLAEAARQRHTALEHERVAAQAKLDELEAALLDRVRLSRALPHPVPGVGAFKALFGSVPADAVLLEAELDAEATPPVLIVRADCGGRVRASGTAAQWARGLADSAYFSQAEVTSVTGYDDGRRATIEIRAVLR